MRAVQMALASSIFLLGGCVSIRNVYLEPDASPRLDVGPFSNSRSALCLSGGGYRAMLFHAGVLYALEQEGRLEGLGVISSVSGGSITNAKLALEWDSVYERKDPVERLILLDSNVINKLQDLAGKTIDIRAAAEGLISPFDSRASRLALQYDQRLFHGSGLQDIASPSGSRPKFIFNSTNLSTGRPWVFSNNVNGGWPYGFYGRIKVPLADVVASSSALPPAFKSLSFDLSHLWERGYGVIPAMPYEADRSGAYERIVLSSIGPKLYLVDGGVVDNKGLDWCLNAPGGVFISDASVLPEYESSGNLDTLRLSLLASSIVYARAERSTRPTTSTRDRLDAIADYLRTGSLAESAVRDSMAQGATLVAGYRSIGDLVYWWELRREFIRRRPMEAAVSDEVGVAMRDVSDLACYAMRPTRLSKLDPHHQDALINLGYLTAIAAIEVDEWSRWLSSEDVSNRSPPFVPVKLPRTWNGPLPRKPCEAGRRYWVDAFVSSARADAKAHVGE